MRSKEKYRQKRDKLKDREIKRKKELILESQTKKSRQTYKSGKIEKGVFILVGCLALAS